MSNNSTDYVFADIVASCRAFAPSYLVKLGTGQESRLLKAIQESYPLADPELQLKMAASLLLLGDTTHIDTLMQVIGNDDSPLQEQAIRYLSWDIGGHRDKFPIAEEQFYPYLRPMIADHFSSNGTLAAVRYVISTENDTIRADILGLLNQCDRDPRIARMLISLANFNGWPPIITPFLIRLLKHPDLEVRAGAAQYFLHKGMDDGAIEAAETILTQMIPNDCHQQMLCECVASGLATVASEHADQAIKRILETNAAAGNSYFLYDLLQSLCTKRPQSYGTVMTLGDIVRPAGEGSAADTAAWLKAFAYRKELSLVERGLVLFFWSNLSREVPGDSYAIFQAVLKNDGGFFFVGSATRLARSWLHTAMIERYALCAGSTSIPDLIALVRTDAPEAGIALRVLAKFERGEHSLEILQVVENYVRRNRLTSNCQQISEIFAQHGGHIERLDDTWNTWESMQRHWEINGITLQQAAERLEKSQAIGSWSQDLLLKIEKYPPEGQIMSLNLDSVDIEWDHDNNDEDECEYCARFFRELADRFLHDDVTVLPHQILPDYSVVVPVVIKSTGKADQAVIPPDYSRSSALATGPSPSMSHKTYAKSEINRLLRIVGSKKQIFEFIDGAYVDWDVIAQYVTRSTPGDDDDYIEDDEDFMAGYDCELVRHTFFAADGTLFPEIAEYLHLPLEP